MASLEHLAVTTMPYFGEDFIRILYIGPWEHIISWNAHISRQLSWVQVFLELAINSSIKFMLNNLLILHCVFNNNLELQIINLI